MRDGRPWTRWCFSVLLVAAAASASTAADGHVQSVATSAAIEVLTALATRDGGEAVDINGL